jgi:NAD+ kinase
MNAPGPDRPGAAGNAGDFVARRILLIAHTGRADIATVARHVRDRLAGHGIELLARVPEADELGLEALRPEDAGPELVLALGGDGTLLRAAEEARTLSAPVLGVNVGRVGFLTEADADHLDDALDAVIGRQYRISERMTVDMTVEHLGETISSGWALNEISVEKASRERILDVVVEVDGRGVSAFGCDGVLCATPTGSTAYAFSAGGPIVWPGVDALLVVPSNAHALFSRPLVVAASSTVAVHVDPAGHGAAVTCDGRRIVEVPPGSRVLVRAGQTPVPLVRLRDEPFTDRLVRKFSLPVHGWRDQRH